MTASSILRYAAIASALIFSSGCITKRTVTQGGQTVESGYVVKRPIKEAIQNTKVER